MSLALLSHQNSCHSEDIYEVFLLCDTSYVCLALLNEKMSCHSEHIHELFLSVGKNVSLEV